MLFNWTTLVLSGVLMCMHSKPQMKPIKWSEEKKNCFEVNVLAASCSKHLIIKSSAFFICGLQKIHVNELRLHRSRPQRHEKQWRKRSKVWREERRRRSRGSRGRRCSLQHDGNKEQMECSCQNELTFTLSLPYFFFFASFLPSFLPSPPSSLSFLILFPQEWGYTLTPLPTRTRTKLSVSSPKRSTPPVSRSRKLLASVRSFSFSRVAMSLGDFWVRQTVTYFG